MYSLTTTNIHYLQPPEHNEPQLKLICKCGRKSLQEQTYTCLACSEYCCYYCTVPQFTTYQCRSCRRTTENIVKNSKCTSCFSCPYCQHVLSLARDPQSRLFIYLCQFCYWSTKEINLKEEKPELLQQVLSKSGHLREQQSKVYNMSFIFFKECNLSIQMENQAVKYSHNKKGITKNLQDSNLNTKQQIEKLKENVYGQLKRVGLEEESDEYVGYEGKYPQPLPLITKKIRRCPGCTKPLTNIYRPVVSSEQSVELMHKDLKVIQCQRTPPQNSQIKIKLLKNSIWNEKEYKAGEVLEIDVGKQYEIKAKIQSKRKNIEPVYQFVVDLWQKKK